MRQEYSIIDVRQAVNIA